MTKLAFQKPDGQWISPRDWIELELEDGRGKLTGRFSGAWHNPNFGIVFQVAFARLSSAPDADPDTWFFVARDKDDLTAETAALRMLQKAVVVPKSGRGKRDAARSEHVTVH